MHNDPLKILRKLTTERYQDAKAIFWAGSIAKNKGTSASDLDLIIIYEKVEQAYREAFIFDGWPIDTFVHDIETLRYFFKDSRKNSGISGLMQMIIEGIEITQSSGFSENIKSLAHENLKLGPAPWDKDKIDKERFLITDMLEDILVPFNHGEQVASAAALYKALAHFYFRAQNKWSASGKAIVRYLENDNPQLSKEYSNAFEKVFQSSDSTDLKALTIKLLKPYGGLLWDGFKSDAPKEYRISGDALLINTFEGKEVFLDESENESVDRILWEGLRAYNESKTGPYSQKIFMIYIKSPEGKVIAGSKAYIFGDHCSLRNLWVEDKYRQHGLGGELMLQVENYARSKNCLFIQLDTAEFQAKPFYDKLGFETLAVLPQGFMNHNQYIMRKML